MRIFLVLSFFIFSLPVFSENVASATSALSVEPIAIRELFRPEEFSGLTISPDGKHLLAIVKKGGSSKIVLLAVSDLKPLMSWPVAEGDYVDTLVWKDNEQFLFVVEKISGNLMNDLKFVFANNWYSANIAGGTPERIYGIFDKVQHLLPHDPKNILVSYRTYESEYFLKVPLKGLWPLNPKLTTTPLAAISNTLFDEDANPLYIWGDRINGKMGSYVRKNDKWEALQIWDEGGAERIPLAFDTKARKVFMAASNSGEPQRIDVLDLATNTTTNVVASGATPPELLLQESSNSSPIAVAYHEDKLKYHFLESESAMKKVYESLIKAFPAHNLMFLDRSADDRFILVFVYSDNDPGDYYLFDAQSNEARYLLSSRPWIKPENMASTQAISYKARDGLTINGYLTLPRESSSKNLPVILMLHGGPHGVRDYWGFDSEVQLLASRGYAVMQVNFRGSGGYGTKFMMDGYRNWGAKMTDDMVDGVRWLSGKGFVDTNRICTYGVSYGAFAALQLVAKEPDMFRCAVGYAGVYSIPLMFKEGDISKTAGGKKFLAKVMPINMDDKAMQSPAFNAAKIKVPVMLAHGRSDARAPIQHYHAMRDSLIKAGNPPKVTVVEKEEGHGFVDLEKQVSMYKKLINFLDSSMGIVRKPATVE